MILTESLIREYVTVAEQIINSCCPLHPPVITTITISKAHSYWAQIKHVKDNHYELRVSEIFNEITDEEQFHNRLLSCMIHEIIHTMPDCWGHGETFKKIASSINVTYPEFNIATSTDGTVYGIQDTNAIIRYIVKCANCGTESKYQRRPKVWKYVNKKTSPYICCKCGKSKFKGIYIN